MNSFIIRALSKGVLFLMLITVSPVFSQKSPSPQTNHPKYLTYEKAGGGLMVKQGKKELNQRELFDVLNEDADASVFVGRYKTKNVGSTALSLVGGGLIGFPLGQAIGGGEPQWVLALAGVGVLAIAIPIAISANKDIKTGIDVYNENLVASAFVPKPIIQFGGQQHGVGLSLKF